MSTGSKKLKLQIGTHSGKFHCDEALACYMLTRHTTTYHNAEIIRSRDPEILNPLPILVDVGGVFDVDKQRFDHHQKSFNESFNADYSDIKLSSAGLIYKYFGKEIISHIIGIDYKGNEKVIDLIYHKIYKEFICALDAIDNGISCYPDDILPKYTNRTDLSSRVNNLNPSWNSGKDIDIMERFKQAMNLAGTEFDEAVLYIYNTWLPARDIVENSINNVLKYHDSGKILVLDQYTVWKSHLFDLEKEKDIIDKFLYIIYQSGDSWRVQTIPINPGSFTARKSLPKEWWGMRNEELSKLSHIDDCVFVHQTGFIGGNKTFEGALKMAIKALEQ